MDKSELPYTCDFCSNRLATHLLVVDMYDGSASATRLKYLLCEQDVDDAKADIETKYVGTVLRNPHVFRLERHERSS